MTYPVQTTPLPVNLPDFQQAWEMVQGELRAEMNRSDFETWVKPIRPLSYTGQVYTLAVYNPFARDMVEARLKSRITQLLSGMLNEVVTLKVVVSNGYYHSEETPAPAAAPSSALAAVAPAESIPETRKDRPPEPQPAEETESGSPRKIMLRRAYGSQRARLIQPERGMFLTMYFFANWVPLIGHSAAMIILAARSMCYWNPMTGELRNRVETEMSDLAQRASVSVRTLKDVLSNELIQKYFLRYRVRRTMTPNGIRTAGIVMQVRMDDPLTPDDQLNHNLPEDEVWYATEFDDESED